MSVMRWPLILLFANCVVGHNVTFNETSAPFNETNSTYNLTTVVFFADFTIDNTTYETACANFSFYVNLICDCLRTSNPEFAYTCMAESIDDIPCIYGNCTCIQTQSRRLMMGSVASSRSSAKGTSMTTRNVAKGVSVDTSKATQVQNPPPGTSDFSTRSADTPADNTGVVVGSSVGGGVAFLGIVGCCLYRRRSKYKKGPEGMKYIKIPGNP